MHSDAASIRRDLIQFGIKKRVVGHLLGMGTIALRIRNVFKKTVPQSQESGSKVLILEPFGLGDIISFEPLVRVLREKGYQIALCGRHEWKALYPEDNQLKWIDAQLPWSAHNENKKYVLKDYTSLQFRSFLRQLHDWADSAIGLDTRGDIRSVALLRLAGYRRVLALENYLGSNLKITPGAAKRIPFDHSLRRWELNLTFLKALDPNWSGARVSGPFFPHLAKRPTAGRNQIGLMPVAPWRGKLWTPEKWQSLVRALEERSLPAAGLCGPGQKDLAMEELKKSVPVTECESVQDWADALNTCRAVVSLDSGPMHFADALGIPTVGLFGQGKLPLWALSNPRSVVISHQDDPDFVLRQPVDKNTESGQKFMSRITVAEVLTALEKILG